MPQINKKAIRIFVIYHTKLFYITLSYSTNKNLLMTNTIVYGIKINLTKISCGYYWRDVFMIFNDDKFHDECAVAGVYGNHEAANLVYLCLYALQHRGQQGTGIAVSDGETIRYEKKHGLVADVYTKKRLKKLTGKLAIGHNRYPTDGNFTELNLQPITAELPIGQCALAYNGNLVNAFEIRKKLIQEGSIFSTGTDSETIMHLLAKRLKNCDIVTALSDVMNEITGAYSLVFITGNTLIGIRDPYGVRPLTLGMMKDGYVLASETVAFDLIDTSFIREIEPGEMVIIDPSGLKSVFPFKIKPPQAPCVFEHIYFARPDSFMFGQSVYKVRKGFGKALAKENPVKADIVIPVPDSGITATMGYAEESGIPMEMGLIRNHYVGRTFIEPSQSIRDFGVRIKLNPVKEIIKDKSIIVVDDSIVRGTTSKKIIKMLRDAGAREIHMRISSPPTMHPCYYGIDTPLRKELISNTHSEEEVRKYIGADSLSFLSWQGMLSILKGNDFCNACFTGIYPIDPELIVKD